MSKPKHQAQQALEVTIMFEPSRLSGEHLADAYAQVVPLRVRKARRCVPEASTDAQEANPIARQQS